MTADPLPNRVESGRRWSTLFAKSKLRLLSSACLAALVGRISSYAERRPSPTINERRALTLNN
jgi:hypothetical protein